MLSRHRYMRPLWLCKSCAGPWPCQPAKLYLLGEYAENRIGLYIHLGTLLYDAVTDLYRLDPNPGPDPRQLHARFLGWLP